MNRAEIAKGAGICEGEIESGERQISRSEFPRGTVYVMEAKIRIRPVNGVVHLNRDVARAERSPLSVNIERRALR